MIFHPEILTATQKKVLKRLGAFAEKAGFYLAGGTALAAYLGHRRSKDFDWFTAARFEDPMRFAATLRDERISFVAGQMEKGTLHGAVSGIRTSFFEYRYPSLEPCHSWPEFGCLLASLQDIACMKLSAVAQRGSKKDFVDIYALRLAGLDLKDMIVSYQRKYSVNDTAHILYALAYFEDAEKERMPVMIWSTDWKTIKTTIQRWVKELAVPLQE